MDQIYNKRYQSSIYNKMNCTSSHKDLIKIQIINMQKKLTTILLPLLLVIISTTGFAAHIEEQTIPIDNQQHLGITIYNENLALVRDARKIPLEKGVNKLAWREVSPLIHPQTTLLRVPGHPSDFQLLEQSFNFDPLTPESLLKSYLGRSINVIYTHPTTGEKTTETATVLAVTGGLVLQFSDRIETNPTGSIAFTDISKQLYDRPTLSLILDNPAPGERQLELSYLTSGLSWQADYVAELNASDSKINLTGLVTLVNQSGASYHNAHLQLVAGNVNVVTPTSTTPQPKIMAMVADAAEYQTIKKESLSDYHLYTLPSTSTLADNQSKQITLLAAKDVLVNKEFLLRGSGNYYFGRYDNQHSQSKPEVFLQFENKGKKLETPLPKGVVRVYKNDSQSNIQFLGEDRIDHTAKDELVRVKLGEALDITATRTQTDFQQLDTPSQRFTETAHKIEVHNTRAENIILHIQEPIPGDWAIISESFPHTKSATNLAKWLITVPSNEKITLSYRVRIKHQ